MKTAGGARTRLNPPLHHRARAHSPFECCINDDPHGHKGDDLQTSGPRNGDPRNHGQRVYRPGPSSRTKPDSHNGRNGGSDNRGQILYAPVPSNDNNQGSCNRKVQIDKCTAHFDNDADRTTRDGGGNAPGRMRPFPPGSELQVSCRLASRLRLD